MARESGLRRDLLALLKPLHAVAIESPIEPGTPDVNCSIGWIELKHLHEWPVRTNTIVQPEHFTPEQRLWLTKRCAVGGSAWLLLRVGREWCLVWGKAAAEHLGVSWRAVDIVTIGNRPAGPIYHWPTPPDSKDLIRQLLHRNWLHS